MISRLRSLLVVMVILIGLFSIGPSRIEAQATGFTYIPMTDIANKAIDHLLSPPSGEVTLGGVPFSILSGSKAAFGTAVIGPNGTITEGTIGGLQLSNVETVHMLLEGGFVLKSLKGQLIGTIEFAFGDGSVLTQNLLAGVHLRETWCHTDPILNPEIICEVDASSDPQVSWLNVWQESQIRGGYPAIAVLDMLSVHFPSEFQQRTLISITFRDLSDPYPGLDVNGITAQLGSSKVFYRGVNVNGPALVIDGNQWKGRYARDYDYNGWGVCNQKVTLIPPTDTNRAKMLRCGLYQKNMWALLSNVPAGDYEVYLYVWENDWPETYSLFIENKLVVKNYNSRGRGYWDKLGPFAVRINDGDIEIGSKGWWSNLSGIEVWRVGSAVNNAAESDNSEQAPTFEPKSK